VSFRTALREFLHGMGGYEFARHAVEERAARESLFMTVTFGDMVGVPVMPPFYALRLLPYTVGDTDIGIPVGGVVVNQVIEPGDLATVPEFVRNRVEMQREHLAAIRDEFPGLVRAVLPLHDDEIRGPAALSATAAELFGSA